MCAYACREYYSMNVCVNKFVYLNVRARAGASMFLCAYVYICL